MTAMNRKRDWIYGAIAALFAALVLFAASVVAVLSMLPKE
jgi:hypothetical protein